MLWEYINEFVIVYLDNILIYFRNKKKHVQYITKVLKALQKTNLRVKSEKSQFHIKRVQFLEFIIITESLQMNSEKIKSVIMLNKYSSMSAASSRDKGRDSS